MLAGTLAANDNLVLLVLVSGCLFPHRHVPALRETISPGSRMNTVSPARPIVLPSLGVCDQALHESRNGTEEEQRSRR